jgi:hypothetical protein
MRIAAVLSLVLTLSGALAWGYASPSVDQDRLARLIVRALRPGRGERVLVRSNAAELAAATRRALESAGAVVDVVPPDTKALAVRLRDVRAYVSLGSDGDASAEEENGLAAWLESGKGRQLIVDPLDADAIDIDYTALSARMKKTIRLLRSGIVRVKTSEGTALQFHLGKRPFNSQDGDASATRAAKAVVPADRTIRLPAGALRVAPEESTVQGRLVVPRARFDAFVATDLQLFFQYARGRATEVKCCDRQVPFPDAATAAPLGSFVARYNDGVPFGEFAIGLNPKLVSLDGEGPMAPVGYGPGGGGALPLNTVRVCVGDNLALGGNVRGVYGGPVRCFDLRNATVESDRGIVVRDEMLP